MQRKRKFLWVAITVGVLVIILGVGGSMGLPWLANHFGFALPGDGGLPYRIAYGGRTYTNLATCAHAGWCENTTSSIFCLQKEQVQQEDTWPLVQVGLVSTLFGSPYPIMAPQAIVSSKQTTTLIYVAGKNCYIQYALEGSP